MTDTNVLTGTSIVITLSTIGQLTLGVWLGRTYARLKDAEKKAITAERIASQAACRADAHKESIARIEETVKSIAKQLDAMDRRFTELWNEFSAFRQSIFVQAMQSARPQGD